MKIINIKITTLFLLTLFTPIASCEQSKGAKHNTSVNKKNLNKMDDIEQLLNNTFPFVEDLLQKHGEFYPLASVVNNSGEIVNVGAYDGDDNPLSDKVIAFLKKGVIAKQSEYRTVSIFYDAKVVDPNTNLKTDAIVVLVESKNKEIAYRFFYPYELTKDSKLIYSKSWKNEVEREMFLN